MASSLTDLYPTLGREISIRDELANTLDGTAIETAKAQICAIRHMRLDSAGLKIPCECVDALTREPDKDRLCPICVGEGWKWDESLSTMYKVLQIHRELLAEPGLINIPLMVFYMRHNATVTKDDKIVELVLDAEGLPVQPYRRQGIWRIHNLEPLRLDKGRLEYLKITAFREDVKHLNGV